MSGNAEYLACLSKQWSDITFIPGTPSAQARSCAEKGMEFAEQVCVCFSPSSSAFVLFRAGAEVLLQPADGSLPVRFCLMCDGPALGR